MIITDHLEGQLSASNADAGWTSQDLELVAEQTAQMARLAFADDRQAAEELHRTAYRIFLGSHRPPWTDAALDILDPPVAMFLWIFAREWDRADRERHGAVLRGIPAEPAAYADWVVDLVRGHASNVQHPLFGFLAEEATYAQLREFFRQETPLDLYFADMLIALAPGIYGPPKLEIAHNFWDEMGAGDPTKTHRALRLQMMDRIDLPASDHESSAEDFLLEEIELANAYFVGAAVRSYATQLTGMLLATESMAPGRLSRQIAGWRRVGLVDQDMTYLLEHTVVDVEHAEDWLREVIQPIVEDHAEATREITLGALRRLDIAGRICDRMMPHLQAAVAETVPA